MLELGTLALEDRYFYRHFGFELRVFPRMLKQILSKMRPGGVSTLEQQLVRIYSGRRERTLRRKVREIILAIALDAHNSKRDILASYMFDSYLGYRLEGVREASEFLFNKHWGALSVEEAVFVSCLYARPFPKALWLRIELNPLGPASPESLLVLGDIYAPAWTSRLRSRYQYGILLVADRLNRR
ncbi:biosynthetic peptidoglycan transglycosylase [Palleronia sp.]|uniref:biosynthetic peptidoglycan transglycosylase n=1 Tax=Palleronia sp. TaxID=1940284 RepID=UPI0035C7B8D2